MVKRCLQSTLFAVMLTGTAQAQDAPREAKESDSETIVVRAIQRTAAYSDVPASIDYLDSQQLQDAGVVDIRGLNQIDSSLFVSSSSSEVNGAVARVRGIGTVGDNPGLEASVATYVDGIYRNRSGVALTELGPLESVELARGPQGTLFGRNVSAGVINVSTARPTFNDLGFANATYSNFKHWRLGLTLNQVLAQDKASARLDGVFVRRRGFMTDTVSGRDVNDRNRFLWRGQVALIPHDDIKIRIVGDYGWRREECCTGAYRPAQTATLNAAGQVVVTPGNAIADLERSLGAVINDNDPFERRVSITPGRSYRADVDDGGVAMEIKYDMGPVNLTAITGWREYRSRRSQDGDFNNLDIFYRDNYNQKFSTLSQEIRLQGLAFDDRVDWLAGVYLSSETLNFYDDFKYGADYDRYVNAVTALSVPNFPGYDNLRAFSQGVLAADGASAATIARLSPLVNDFTLAETGLTGDSYRQRNTSIALFTHNIVSLIEDRVFLTVGARYTLDIKRLDASLNNSNTGCASIRTSITDLRAVTGPDETAATALAGTLSNLTGFPCVISPIDGRLTSDSDGGRRKDGVWTGTAALSWKVRPDTMVYTSYSRGYKTGGFNFDRAALDASAPSLRQLQFDPETVDAYEVGTKYRAPNVTLSATLFYERFRNFQLNTFSGANFVVDNILACRDNLNGGDTDLNPDTGACAADRTVAGVTSHGVELAAGLTPLRDVRLDSGFTLARARYRRNLVGHDGNPLPTSLFQIPGQALSNAPEYVVTQSVRWTPPLGSRGFTGLAYLDARYQSQYNTGSDLDVEKLQTGFLLLNARLGVSGPNDFWSVEFWARNLLDKRYIQVGFDEPLQGRYSRGALGKVNRGQTVTSATQLYGAFLGEPRTVGVSVRTTF